MLFFFKQKTAYEMRISDWSSDVCSSDLKRAIQQYGDSNEEAIIRPRAGRCNSAVCQCRAAAHRCTERSVWSVFRLRRGHVGDCGKDGRKIGRASCRERVCQYG